MSESEQETIERIKGAQELGLTFVRTLILLNGGACAVLMTYMANAQIDLAIFLPLAALKTAMLAFLIGIVSILMALLLSYGYTAPNPDVRAKRWMDDKVIPTNLGLSLLSLGAFCTGVISLVIAAERTTLP